MKVLLTGGNGFVGSHILDALCARDIPAVLLARPTSDLQFVRNHLPRVELRRGSVADPASLREALSGITHVIHCAGTTKASRLSEFDAVNRGGTAHLVDALDTQAGQIRRLVLISSLAACGPGTAQAPARETDAPHPVSEYGRSKLAAERAVTERCRAGYTILRPPAVYGPRDGEFLRLFRTVQRGWAPAIAGGRQPLSLVYGADLASAAVACLDHPAAAGKIFHVAGAEVVTGTQVTDMIARALGCRVKQVPVPGALVRLVCAAATAGARLSGRASLLAHDKHRELLAPGWVCDAGRLQRELGVRCPTPLSAGAVSTLAWYREHRWLAWNS
ncbi:MAG TPA: NAD-dependent epimerase/dehydratase family protein [Verrucomicrobiota bacterium]|nr:NAD-dependent epimerase/dehydratase family protein [Verrucomicrobiota bacterium]HRZ36218.1 NAD-dependent epimerase/dehydratase family protein [Candidatus Paceibacterota bacterium]HRZ54106.1 NAD-dependent epimerase/dehydratase family protein [Candidatus Paceibacterota bacterium]